VFTTACWLSLASARSIHSTPSHHTYLRSILIVSSHLLLRVASGLFPSSAPIKLGIHFCSSPCPHLGNTVPAHYSSERHRPSGLFVLQTSDFCTWHFTMKYRKQSIWIQVNMYIEYKQKSKSALRFTRGCYLRAVTLRISKRRQLHSQVRRNFINLRNVFWRDALTVLSQSKTLQTL
jgi:hypothetical protein